MARCRSCQAASGKAWREKNPDKARRNRLAWNEAHPDRVKEQQRRKTLLSRYGITPEQLDQMLADQGGICAIEGCDGPAERIDHDHATGAVRGVLCHHCNVWLAPLEPDQAGWREAADRYIQEGGVVKKYSSGEVLPEPDAPIAKQAKGLTDEDIEQIKQEGEDTEQ